MLWRYQFLILLVACLLIIGGLPHTDAQTGPITRTEIQQFFRNTEGNAGITPLWFQYYQKRLVTWEGKVFRVDQVPYSDRTEIKVKILPGSMLYDTVVVLENRTPLTIALQKKDIIRFQGKIIRGIDAFGVKLVHVLVDEPGDITRLK